MRWTRTVPAPGSGSIFAAYERYGSPSRAATPAGHDARHPVRGVDAGKHEVELEALERRRQDARRGHVSEPSRAGSVTWTPLAAPIASALRIVSGAFAGAIETSVTSPPCASTSLSAASSAYSSLPLTTAGAGGPVEPAVRAEALAARRGIGDGLDENDDAHEAGTLPALGRGGRPDGGLPVRRPCRAMPGR